MQSGKHILLIPTAVLACIMCSSFGRSISIDRRGLVHAIGIDTAEHGYKVTMQIFQPTGGGADTAVDSTKPNITVAVSEGRTVGEAISAARSSTGKELFFGHLQLICIGRDVSLADPYALFAFALGDKNISPAAELCMAENTASELMEIRLSEEEISSEALSGVLKLSGEYTETVSCDLITLLTSDGHAAMPMLTALSEQNSSEQKEDSGTEVSRSIKLKGTAVTESSDVLDRQQATAAAMLCGKADKACVVSKIGNFSVTSSLEDISAHRTIDLKNGRLLLTNRITLTARPDRQLDSRESDALAQAISARFRNECDRLQTEMLSRGEDIFGISQLIKHKFPELWLKNADNTDTLLAAVIVHTDVLVKVD
ncbi:Ger(x)C family spore germination C-terminal domain-containing protein [Ruminococcus sp.]|uniref:Ger(x)C family spore germination protein n=1 Tax=Ruminococcus sp. TaxID=41978 RepID=UPI0025F1F980|nr:Ger(x)C family spore germination C-terminal domain-containing protein [Ruminococcus sp.]MBQ9541782.1 hypothetical protein [Ruminococcus sp.]